MWYEILPSVLIIAGAMSIPIYGTYYINDYIFGTPYLRRRTWFWERRMSERDCRLGGAEWNIVGLENIPDKPN